MQAAVGRVSAVSNMRFGGGGRRPGGLGPICICESQCEPEKCMSLTEHCDRDNDAKLEVLLNLKVHLNAFVAKPSGAYLALASPAASGAHA